MQCHHKAFALHNIVVYEQRLNQVLQQASKHSRVKHIWIRTSCAEDFKVQDRGDQNRVKMFGFPLAGPKNVFCGNNGVVKNTSIPKFTLSKKNDSMNYHSVLEVAAPGIMRVIK